jgi:hypothetical protein
VLRLLALVLACCFAAPVAAKDPAVLACIREAARDFKLSELTLRVLYKMEGGTLGKVSQNTNGTVDIGPMQINSSWLRTLAPAGISLEALRDDACTNVYVAAWIYQQELKRAGGDDVMAIARYHSPTPRFQARYLRRVSSILDAMVAGVATPPAAPTPHTTAAQRAADAANGKPQPQRMRSPAQLRKSEQGLQLRSIAATGAPK